MTALMNIKKSINKRKTFYYKGVRLSHNRLIYIQAKALAKAIPVDSDVYIHWDIHGNPVVLPQKEPGHRTAVQCVKLSAILNKQVWLDS